MKTFQTLQWTAPQCQKELQEFQRLLQGAPTLKEREHILPFFKSHLHLSAFVGTYHADLTRCDLVAHEYDLFGDFSCDLAVGDSERKVYGFIEFEDAAPNSVFVRKRGKASLEWAPRLEHGFSQVLDWFSKLADMEKTDEFLDRFGKRAIEYFGLLVIGRETRLAGKELRRLEWRRDKVLINGHKVHCVTFDQLYMDLFSRLQRFLSPPARTRARGQT